MSQSPAITSPEPREVSQAARSRWKVALAIFGLAIVALSLGLHDPVWRLWDLWLNSFEYGHGLVVVPVTVYLLWLRRDQLRAQTPAPDWLGLVLTAGLMVAWFASRILGIVLGEEILLVLLLLTVTMGVLGRRIAALAALPVLYLMFAVPIWSYLSPMMQTVTAEISTSMSRALGVPVYLEGLYMTIPDGRFLVAETCSGLRYLLAALSLGGFYALLNLHSTWARCVIVLFCAAFGVVFNWVRVAGVVLIGHHSQMQSTIVEDHLTFGWVLFLGVVVATLIVGRQLERLEGPMPAFEPPPPRSSPSMRAFVGAGSVGIAVILVPVITAAQVLEVDEGVPDLHLPATLDGERWSRESFPVDAAWRPRFQGARVERTARYRDGTGWVDVYVAYYPVQRQDAEVVNGTNLLFEGNRWRRYSQKAVATRIEVTSDLPVSEYRIVSRRSANRRLVWWTFWVDAQFTTDKMFAKWLQLRSAFSGRPQAAALVFSTEFKGGEDGAREYLYEFAKAARPSLLGVLENAGAVH